MSAIESAVRAVTEADQRVKSTAEAVADADEKIAVLRERSSVLDTERVAIVSARKAGTIDPAQGARLHEIAVDREGLAELIEEADRAARPLRTAAADAMEQAAVAREMLRRAENETYLAALVAHATEAARLFDATLVELTNATAAAGEQRSRWYPPAALADRIYKLRLIGDQLGAYR
jgi:hypothetical protein